MVNAAISEHETMVRGETLAVSYRPVTAPAPSASCPKAKLQDEAGRDRGAGGRCNRCMSGPANRQRVIPPLAKQEPGPRGSDSR